MENNFNQFGQVKADPEATGAINGWSVDLAAIPDMEEGDDLGFFRPVPEGDYDFVVTEIENTYSKAGNKMIKLYLTLPMQGQREVRLNDYLVFTENAAFKIKQFLKSIGWQKNAIQAEDWKSIPTMSGRLKLKHEVYDGKTRNKVDGYIPKGAPAVQAW